MKKTTSLFIALIFLVSVVSFAVAEGNATNLNAANISDEKSLNETNLNSSLEETANDTEKNLNNLENETNEAQGIAEESNDAADIEVVDATPSKPAVVAQKPAETVNNSDETPSVTPDNTFMWGLKRAVERLDLLLTFGKSAKAQKGLAHARERLLELQAMVSERKFDAAEKAAFAYNESIIGVENVVDSLGERDDEKSADELKQVQQQVQKHEQELAGIHNKIKSESSGLNIEQQNAMTNLLISVISPEQDLKVKANQIEIKTKSKDK